MVGYEKPTWWNKNKEISFIVWFLLDRDKVQMINKRNNSSQISLPWGLTGNCFPFISLVSHILITVRYCIAGEGRFLSNSGRLCVFFFFISVFALINECAFGFHFCFRSLLIDTHLVFIWYFISVPLRRGYRGTRISVFVCSFVPVSFCIFDYLYWGFWFFVDCFVTPSTDIQKKFKKSQYENGKLTESLVLYIRA